MDSPERFTPGDDGDTGDESDGHGWFTAREVRKLPLHPGFAKSWDTVRKSGAAEKPSPPRVLYHYSPHENRQGIESGGLQPRHPQTGESLAERDGGPAGVYLFPDRAQAEMLDDGDVYEVASDGLDLQPDPFHKPGVAWYSPGPVPREKVRRVSAAEDPSRAAFLLIQALNEDGKRRILLHKRSKDGRWGLPGGRAHRGEDLYEAALREAAEEIGPLPELERHSEVVLEHDGRTSHVYLVSAPMFAPDLDKARTDETEGAGWFSKGEIADLDIAPGFERIWDEVHGDLPPKEAVRTAAKGYDLAPRSGMIYLEIPEGTIQSVPGGVDDHHITLVYLGSGLSDEAFAEACLRARGAAARHQPMTGILRGVDTFPPSESSDNRTVAFVPAYIPGIGTLRRELEDLSASEHQGYRPHVTLAYLDKGEKVPDPHPARTVPFTHLAVKCGDDVVRFPLGG